MSKQRTDGPGCIACGVMLRPYRAYKGFETEEEAREFARLMDPNRNPRVKQHTSWRDNEWEVTYQVGWGCGGDNRFCSGNCGYAWAVKHSKPAPLPARKEA